MISASGLGRAFAALVLAFSFAAVHAAETIRKESISFQGVPRTFYLFVPDGVGASRPAPVIVLLHGSGRNGLSLVEKWTDLARSEHFIVIGPDSRDSQRGWVIPGDGPDFLRLVVDAVGARYPVNPRAVYLFGHSAGAMFALSMSLLQSEYFAATAIHAGTLDQDGIKAIPYAKRKIPIAIYVGTRDQRFPLLAVRATRDTLVHQGFPVELTEMPDHDHWYYDLAPKINAAAWAFLKKYEAGQPRYLQYRFVP